MTARGSNHLAKNEIQLENFGKNYILTLIEELDIRKRKRDISDELYETLKKNYYHVLESAEEKSYIRDGFATYEAIIPDLETIHVNVQSFIRRLEYIEEEKKRNPLKQRGLKKSKLTNEDRVLLTLYYLRHYPTFINLADIFEFSESYCQKIYSRYAIIFTQVETLPLSKNLLENPPDTLIIDVTEQPIERPVKGQKPYYSGKKKKHTVKVQILSDAMGEILSVDCASVQQHDFSIFKESDILIHPNSELLADSGYQGLNKYHENSVIPIKKKKGVPQTKEAKIHNKALSKRRILIENINRLCQIFRCVKEVYRGQHKNYGLIWRLVAALVNLRCRSI